MNLQVSITDYTYSLPAERIALFPLPERDQSRLLVYRQGIIAHETFLHITDHLPANTTLFFNNTKVIQARLHFEKSSGAVVEVFLLNPVFPSTHLIAVMQSTSVCRWNCTIGNLKRWKDKTVLEKSIGGVTLRAILLDRAQGLVEFRWNDELSFAEVIDKAGQTPLPPYLKRPPAEDDKIRYQTVYSRNEGAVAAPTAGLHFTEKVLSALSAKGIEEQFLTLHVSAGTFQPVKVENAAEHPMHREQVIISRQNVEALLKSDRFVVAVGTTSMRTLESIYWYGVKLAGDKNAEFMISQQDAYTLDGDVPLNKAVNLVLERMKKEDVTAITGETAIYIMPGYRFRVCRGLVTNFHQPNSTLILLVAAFVGNDWKRIYDEALRNDYRFLSYGDSSLLIP
jgi:S-adenosylmethionine:tRNA ribosyltransferase-isomerase